MHEEAFRAELRGSFERYFSVHVEKWEALDEKGSV